MKKLVTVISIICVLIICGVTLILTGVIDIGKLFEHKEEQPGMGKSIVWLECMNSYICLDRDSNVTATLQEPPEGMMKVSGINIEQMVIGSKAIVDNPKGLEYALVIADNLEEVGISDVGEIFISSDNEAICYIGNIRILFGYEEGIAKKIEDLKKFYKDLEGLSGTLDMKIVDKKNMGYTFKKNEE